MEKTFDAGITVIEESMALSSLVIGPDAQLAAPEGKYLTLTADGVTHTIEPGEYRGDVKLTVSENFTRSSSRFGEITTSNYHAAVIVDDGRLQDACSVSAAVQGGTVTDTKAENLKIESQEWDFNGFYLTGDTEYEISNAEIYLTGDGTDDFVGLGSGIAASGNTRLTINNTKIHNEGIGRGTLFCGGNSKIEMNDCDFSIVSYVPTPEQMAAGKAMDRMMEPPWSIGIRGNGRALNLAENGQLTVNRSHVTSNNWGVLSVDGACVNRMYVNDSLIEITGDNGYGCFCIADDLMFDYESFDEPGCLNVIDHSVFNVAYTAVLMSLGNGCAEFKNGSVVNSRRFGAFVHRHNGGWLKVNSGAEMHTDKSVVCVKGSNLNIEFDDCVLDPKNGTIVQLMDNDDVGMCDDPFLVPVGETDVRDDRDLTRAIADEDVFVSISNMEARGDFLNSTTNLMACNRRLPKPEGAPEMPPPPPGAEKLRGFIGETLMGAKNLDLEMTNASVTGVISAADAAYGEGITQINYDNFNELSNITQTPAPAINNGVIVRMDKDSTWNVTGTSYLTSLTLSEGAVLQGADGQALQMTVDGLQTQIRAGSYQGAIVLSL